MSRTTAPHTHRRAQVFEVSTLYGAATLAAALDAGLFGPREATLRVLLVSNNAAIPETAVQLPEMAGFAALAARFDDVVDWNREIAPHHPGTWAPAGHDAPIWQRMLRRSWGLGDGPLELVVESVTAAPAKALTMIFGDASVHVYADGLMSYGPTRDPLPQYIACRVRRLLHLDLVPGLAPLLLTEYGVPAELVPSEVFRKVLDELSEPVEVRDARGGVPTAVVLGQYLAALGILTQAEEEELLARMVRGAAAAGHTSVLFKPHPTAPASYSRALERAAEEAGAVLTTLERPMLAETLYEQLAPRLVVGCFSTAMLTAAGLYGIPIARTGTELLLRRLRPYQNSNRVPVTIVDAVVPDVDALAGGAEAAPRRSAAELGPLLTAVGYCMQDKRHRRLRPAVVRWLSAHQGEETLRYITRRRLTALELPGGVVSGAAARRLLPAARRAVRTARKVKRLVR
ncbi:polysialyltransferase family glycosyltransferase [Streptomyces polyrhachis]|uniref:Polysialyltransferase family glycosyltransferase n=1 Tax=Streptomyces polyrhachis TaxID=1282885 RepID=A0ABW2GJ26_9ACTN